MKRNEDGVLALGANKFYDEIIETNLKDRKIVLNNNIDAAIIEDVCLYILKWNKEDANIPVEKRKKIFIFTNSFGGDVFTGLFLCDVIVASKTPVATVCLAYGYSMGGIIFMCAKERIMFKSSSLLIHDGSTSLSGSSGKVKDLQAFYGRVDARIKEVIVGL